MYRQEQGRKNEKIIEREYKERGYQVLNVNDKGFPDLVILKNGKIERFIEVKAPKHKVHGFQKAFHKQLEAMGFQVEIRIIEE